MVRRASADKAQGVLTDVLNAATAFVDWLSTLDSVPVLLFTFLSTVVEMTFLLGLLVPGESVVMLAGSLPDGPTGFALAVAVGTAGALTGQTLGYAVGRAFGTRLRTTALGRRIGADRFDRAEVYLRTNGAPALVAVRFVAVIHAVVPIVAGTARMPFARFLGWSALGTVLWVGAFAGAGAATAEASTGGIAVVLTAVGATCLGVLPLGVRLLRRMLTGGGRRAAGGPVLVAAASGPVVSGSSGVSSPVVVSRRPAGSRSGAAASGSGAAGPVAVPARPATASATAAAPASWSASWSKDGRRSGRSRRGRLRSTSGRLRSGDPRRSSRPRPIATSRSRPTGSERSSALPT